MPRIRLWFYGRVLTVGYGLLLAVEAICNKNMCFLAWRRCLAVLSLSCTVIGRENEPRQDNSFLNYVFLSCGIVFVPSSYWS
jgi:hypothetical protein